MFFSTEEGILNVRFQQKGKHRKRKSEDNPEHFGTNV